MASNADFWNQARKEIIQKRALEVFQRDQHQRNVDSYDKQLEALALTQSLAEDADRHRAEAAAEVAAQNAAAQKATNDVA